MVAQVNYTKFISGLIPGLIRDLGPTKIDSFAAEEVIGHGLFVTRGTDPLAEVLLGDALSIGVSVRHASENDYKPAQEVTPGEYAIEETVGVMRQGYIIAQFDAAGGTQDSAVTINADGTVDSAGGATALTNLKARIEVPAVSVVLEGALEMFLGVIKLGD